MQNQNNALSEYLDSNYQSFGSGVNSRQLQLRAEGYRPQSMMTGQEYADGGGKMSSLTQQNTTNNNNFMTVPSIKSLHKSPNSAAHRNSQKVGSGLTRTKSSLTAKTVRIV